MKLIRLTESDLKRIVRRVIKESENNYDDMSIVEIARTQIGVPYRSAGLNPKESSSPGFDCSGFAKWLLKAAGYFNDENGVLDKTVFTKFPGSVQSQYDNSKITKLSKDEIQAGDFVYFTRIGHSFKGHVGLISEVYDDNFSMIHAGKKGIIEVRNVSSSAKNNPDWWGKITGYGRFNGTRNLPKKEEEEIAKTDSDIEDISIGGGGKDKDEILSDLKNKVIPKRLSRMFVPYNRTMLDNTNFNNNDGDDDEDY